jgi:cytochrome c-type biogenesis protein CcmE
MKKLLLIIIAILSLTGIFYFSTGFISPYDTFAEAKTSGSKTQIIGYPVKNKKVGFDESGCLLIEISDHYDPSTQIVVKHCRATPKNIEHAESIVAHGTYDIKSGYFIATKLYYKCPSKYRKQAEDSNEGRLDD